MKFHVLTLFPQMVQNGLSESIIGRAAKSGILSVDAVDIRDYTTDKHKKVDDYPYGGGAGMLMQAQPVFDAYQAVAQGREHIRTIYVTPQGPLFTQEMAKEFAKEEELIFLCGHYEGIDERVLDEIVTDYVSIGDYVLTGGELPAMVMIDAISRMVSGVLTNDESGRTESLEGNLLEYPQYSRPEEWRGKRVPDVLLSGNQKEIRQYRLAESVRRTKERRPDLYAKYDALEQCRERLMCQKLLHMDMIELIRRGQARLLYVDEQEICLRDIPSGIFYHTIDVSKKSADSSAALAVIRDVIRQEKSDEEQLLVLHQEEMLAVAERVLHTELLMGCHQAVYTRKEKIPIRRLYTAGTGDEKSICIRRLTEEHFDIVVEHYSLLNDPEYIRARIREGSLFGAFFGETLAGFVGMHVEGSMGMLEVLPQYQRQKVGQALETFMINHCVERDMTPFAQIVCGNVASESLQQSLGLYASETLLYWTKTSCNFE
jgi:tRNA (guanine37-N1)-methyltransferase